MAVGTNEVALCDLGQDSFPTPTLHPGDVRYLDFSGPVVVIHALWRKCSATVHAGKVFQCIHDDLACGAEPSLCTWWINPTTTHGSVPSLFHEIVKSLSGC